MKKILFVCFELLLFLLAYNINAQSPISTNRIYIRGTPVDSVRNDTSNWDNRRRSIPTLEAVYEFVKGRTTGIEGGFKVESIAALRASTNYAADKVADVLGYFTKGDPGGGAYFFNSASTATDNDGNIIRPTAIGSGSPGRWIRVDQGVVRAATFGITNDLTNQTTKLQALVNISTVTRVILDNGGKIALDGKLTMPVGTDLEFRNGTMLTSAGGANDTLLRGYVVADINQHVFDTTLTVLELQNQVRNVKWFGAKNDAISGGPTPTDNLTPFLKAINSATVPGIVYAPGATDNTGYFYSFSSTLNITKRVEIYGDGAGSVTTLLFPGSGPGIVINVSSGKAALRKLRVRGSYQTSSAGFNSSTAHGIHVKTNSCILRDIEVMCFDGDGIRREGSPSNSNTMDFYNIVSEFNGRAGYYDHGGDANAGHMMRYSSRGNARYGIWSNGFLGSEFYSLNISSNVVNHPLQQSAIKYRAAVSHGGNRFRIKSSVAGHTNKEPGVAADWATYWELIGAGGIDATFQAWSSIRAYQGSTLYFALEDHSGKEPTIASDWEDYWVINGATAPPFWVEWYHDGNYLHGGGIFSENANARNLFFGYTEGDQPCARSKGPAQFFGQLNCSGAINYTTGPSGGYMRQVSPIWIQKSDANSNAGIKIDLEDVSNNSWIELKDTETGSWIKVRNYSTSGSAPGFEFMPQLVSGFNQTVFIHHAKNGTGSNPVVRWSARDSLGTSGITSQSTYSWQNLSTVQLELLGTNQVRIPFLGTTGTKIVVTDNDGDLSAGSIDPATLGPADLSYTASPTNGIVTSSTGADATIPLVTTTNAGLMPQSLFDSLSKTSSLNIVGGPTGFYPIGKVMSDTLMHLKSLKLTVNGGAAIAPTVTDSSAHWDLTGIGGGNVSNTGTPLANQLAVWNLATTLRGEGNATHDGSLLNALISTSGTNSVLFPFKVTRLSTGTPTTGLGVGMQFEAENASNTNRVIGTIEAAYTDAVNATEDNDFVFKNIVAGTLTERMRIASTGIVTMPLVKITSGSPGSNKVLISDADGDGSWANVHDISKPRNGGTTSTSTPTPDWDAQDLYVLSALVTNPTFQAPTGTPVLGQRLEILIIPDGTPRTIAWNSIYVGGTDLPLPLITEASKTMWMTFRWNSLATGGGKLQLVGHVGGIAN